MAEPTAMMFALSCQ